MKLLCALFRVNSWIVLVFPDDGNDPRIHTNSLHAESQHRPDHIDIPRSRAAVVLSQYIQVAGEVLIKGVTGPHTEPIANPVVHSPVIKSFFGNEEGELCLANVEGMLELNAITITPRIHLG